MYAALFAWDDLAVLIDDLDDDMDPAEREAWRDVEAVERELERAFFRLADLKEKSRRRSRRHLRIVPERGEPCDARR